MPESINEKVQYSVFRDNTLTKDTIKQWLRKDIQGVAVLVNEILHTEEVLNAIVDVFYARYEALKAQTKIEENGNDVPGRNNS